MTGNDLIKLADFIKQTNLGDKNITIFDYDDAHPKEGCVIFCENEESNLMCSLDWNGKNFKLYKYFSIDDGYDEISYKEVVFRMTGQELIDLIRLYNLEGCFVVDYGYSGMESNLVSDSEKLSLCMKTLAFAIDCNGFVIEPSNAYIYLKDFKSIPIIGITGYQIITLIQAYQLEKHYILKLNAYDLENGDYLEFGASPNRILWLHDDYLQDVVFIHAGELTYSEE